MLSIPAWGRLGLLAPPMVLTNACLATILGNFPFLGTDYAAWQQEIGRAAALTGPMSTSATLIIGTFLGGVVSSALLILYLVRRLSMDYRSFLRHSAAGGVLCAVVIVYITSFLFLPVSYFFSSAWPEGKGIATVALEAGIGCIVWGTVFSLLFSPIILLGGGIFGLANGVVLRFLAGGEKT